ncbi:MAG: glycosyltransferase [Stellaceae bacterium]
MKPRRDILFVSSNFPPVIGGSSVVYDQLCRNAGERVVALGASRNYLTSATWPDLTAEDRRRGYLIHRLPYLRPPAVPSGEGTGLARLLRQIRHDVPAMAVVLAYILVLIARYRVKVVCLGELIYGGWLVLPLRYVFRRRVFIYTHGEEISQETDSLLARRRGLFLRHAHGVIAVSMFCKGQIIAKHGVDPARIHIVHNGVDLAVFRPGEADRSCLPPAIRDRRIILSVSRLVPRKGQENLVRAMPRIVALAPDAHCVIVGEGPIADRLRAVACELGVVDRCTLLGAVSLERLVELYRSCEVFALPCHTLPDGDTEGFGLVFLEANACGKPVVAGDAGGTIEAVVDGETGLIVDGTDPAAVAEAALHLLDDPVLAARLGKGGRWRAQQRGWNAATQEFLRACGRDRVPVAAASYHMPSAALALPHDVTTSPLSLLVTVDVEEEFGWTEFDRHRFVVRGAEALRAFHDDCGTIGVKPVYLLTYPILVDPAFRRFFEEVQADASGELGIHLHSWTAPPFWEEANVFTSYQRNLPEHVERRKLEMLCRTFEASFGRPATIHRAGRWGGGERTAALLEELGIEIDLSPSAGYTDKGAGGPDFSNIDGSPFWSGPNGRVLTIPASAIKYLRGPPWLSPIVFDAMRASAKLAAIAQRFGTPVRFSPEGGGEAMLTAMLRELRLRQLPTAVYTLHSTSLYDGGNPYSTGRGASMLLRRRSLGFLAAAIDSGQMKPVTSAQLLDAAKRERASTLPMSPVSAAASTSL